ncbi:MAG: hypothetical protein ACTS80_00725 [Candidatus Hodgkinia cicadicola]
MGNNVDRSMKLTFALLTLTSLISAERCAATSVRLIRSFVFHST